MGDDESRPRGARPAPRRAKKAEMMSGARVAPDHGAVHEDRFADAVAYVLPVRSMSMLRLLMPGGSHERTLDSSVNDGLVASRKQTG